MTSAPPRTGFTLIELLVALLIGGLVIAMGRVTLDSLVALERAAGERLDRAQASGMGRFALARAVATVRMSAGVPFVGTATDVSFRSRCPDAYGGLGPCDVQLSSRAGLILRERLLDGSARSLLIGAARGHLDYVISAAGAGTVTTNWTASDVAPLAIRWLPDAPGSADTLILPILRSAP